MKYIAILSTLGSLASAGIVEARTPQASPGAQVSTPARNDTVLYENLVGVNIMFAHFMCDQLTQFLGEETFMYGPEHECCKVALRKTVVNVERTLDLPIVPAIYQELMNDYLYYYDSRRE
ncbi:hypothetical protein MANI_008931 [Metarhizium anisopliae]|uniref:Uncharacterized protein n=2 Tax=Metarhizium TaxID=5529 RepID=A0A0D9NVN1_METAN